MNVSRVKFVKGGKIFTLPPGFKFHPSDEELVFEFLKDRIFSGQAVSMIPDIDSCNVDPWDLLDVGGQEKYFFFEKKPNDPDERETANGYWEGIGEEEVKSSENNSVIIGMKRTFVFYLGKNPRRSETDWTMHEFRMVDLGARSRRFSCNARKILDKWRVVRVFLKKNETDEDDDSDNVICSVSSSWSESSSEVTDVSFMESDGEDMDTDERDLS